jgi:hypothetical protein
MHSLVVFENLRGSPTHQLIASVTYSSLLDNQFSLRAFFYLLLCPTVDGIASLTRLSQVPTAILTYDLGSNLATAA